MIKKLREYCKLCYEVGRFSQLVREVNEPFVTKNAGRIRLDTGKKRDPLQELAEILSQRDGIAFVFDKYKIESSRRSGELVRLFNRLVANGAGQWIDGEFVPTVVLYDVNLLNLMLDTERKKAEGVGELMALLALKYVKYRERLLPKG